MNFEPFLIITWAPNEKKVNSKLVMNFQNVTQFDTCNPIWQPKWQTQPSQMFGPISNVLTLLVI